MIEDVKKRQEEYLQRISFRALEKNFFKGTLEVLQHLSLEFLFNIIKKKKKNLFVNSRKLKEKEGDKTEEGDGGKKRKQGGKWERSYNIL